MSRTVLVVEDNEKNLELFRDILEVHGFRVIIARDGDEAIRVAEEALPHLILMDVQLPKTDGVTAAKRLKSSSSTKHIPIVALTAHAMKGDKERFISEGFDHYIAKPIMMKELVQVVSSVIDCKKDLTF